MKNLLSVGLISLGLLSTAGAAERNFRPYIGVEVGASGIGSDYAVFDDEAYGMLKGNIGFRYGKYFGAEISYEGSEEVDYTYAYAKDTGSYTAFGFDVLGYLPLAKYVDILGSIGVAKYDFEAKWNNYYYNTSGKISKDTTMARFGIGAQFNLNENIGFTAMVKYSPVSITMNGYDYVDGIVTLTVGLKLSF